MNTGGENPLQVTSFVSKILKKELNPRTGYMQGSKRRNSLQRAEIFVS